MSDDPIQVNMKDAMNAMAVALDRILNGEKVVDEKLHKERQNGFVLLVFPFNDKSGRCNYISNGADRKDIIRMFKEQIKRFEELDSTKEELPMDEAGNMTKINQACHDLRDGKITRDQCKSFLINECNVADFNLDILLDAYNPPQKQS